MLRVFSFVTLLLALAVPPRILPARGQAASADAPPVNLNDPALIKEGGELYDQICRYCHGKEGQGGRGPTLRGRGFDSQHVFARVTNGYPPMPAFNQVYTPEQVWKIVAFVQAMK